MSWAVYRATEILFGSRRVAATANDPAQRHADGGGRHADRHAGRAAVGRLELAVVCTREGAGDRAGRVVACGWRCRRRGGSIEIHRAVLRPGDPALADRDPEAAALADLAMALSRRAGRDCDVRPGHSLECRTSLGILHQADGAGADRGFQAGFHRRIDPDADCLRNPPGVDTRRDGTLCARHPPRPAQWRRAC